MQEGVLVSGGGKLRILSPAGDEVLRETAIDDCGAVCAGMGMICAASEKDRVIYRLDERLLPRGVFAGGPGMSVMRMTKGAEKLFVLLSDADSVLMIGGQEGMPMFLARVGANPRQMRLESEERYLTIAGGRDGTASVLCAKTLKCLHVCRGEGVCCDAIFYHGSIFGLLLTPAMNTCLMRWEMRGQCCRLTFPGEPGSLYCVGNTLLVCAGQWLYVYEAGEMRLKKKFLLACAPGRLIPAKKELLLLCPEDDALYRLCDDGLQLLCRQARDAAVV